MNRPVAALGRAVTVALSVVLLPAVRTAAAGPPCAEGPWVLLGDGAPRGLDRAAVRDRLASELAARHIQLCAQPPRPAGEPPLATVAIAAAPAAVEASPGSEMVVVEIEVRDELTAKRVSRPVDLSGVPADARAVVVALAVDELLRASWAELALAHAPPPKRPVPREVSVAIGPLVPPARPPALEVGFRGAFEAWSGGLVLFGADAAARLRLSSRLVAELALGGRASPAADAPDGSLDARAFSARLRTALTLTRPDAGASLALGAGLSGYVLRLEGQAEAGAHGAAATAPALTLEVGPSVSIALGDVGAHLVVEGALGTALSGVAARDDGVSFAGLTGVAAIASLGVVAGVL